MTASDLSQNGVVRMATVSTQQMDANTTGDVDMVMIGAIVGGVLGLLLICGIIVAIVVARNRRSSRVTNTIEITNVTGLVNSSSQYGFVPKQNEHYDVGDISLKE